MSPPSAHTRSKGAEPEYYPLKGKIGGKISVGRPRKPVVKDRTHKVTEAKVRKPAGSNQSTPTGAQTCPKYLIGKCNGKCKNKHPPICRKFLQGKCKSKCSFAHPEDPALHERHVHLLEIEKEEREAAKQEDTVVGKNTIQVQQGGRPGQVCLYGSQCRNLRCRFSHAEHGDQ